MFDGHVDRIDRECVVGWAMKSGALEEQTDVLVYVNGERWAQVTCDKYRPDLAELGTYGDGYHGFRHTFTRPLAPEFDAHIVVRSAEDGQILRNGERRLIGAGPSTKLSPILVTAPGRSGTTLLMSRLCQSDAIVGAEIHPYEVRLLAYYATAYNVLTSPSNLERSTHPDKLEGDGFHVGFNPFSHESYNRSVGNTDLLNEYFRKYVPDEVLRAFRASVAEYYIRLSQDQGKSSAQYFVEKTNNLHRQTRFFPRLAFDNVKEIILVRDPRDLVCSHIAYFKVDSRAAADAIVAFSSHLLSIYAENNESVFFLRYEDLVTGDVAAFSRLSAFLGIEINHTDLRKREASIFGLHGTSSSPASSIGRWRSDLDAATSLSISTRCRDLLREFGYPPA